MDTACVPVDPAETEEYTVNIAKSVNQEISKKHGYIVIH